MFFQGVKISQRDSVTWSINFYCLAAMQLDRVETRLSYYLKSLGFSHWLVMLSSAKWGIVRWWSGVIPGWEKEACSLRARVRNLELYEASTMFDRRNSVATLPTFAEIPFWWRSFCSPMDHRPNLLCWDKRLYKRINEFIEINLYLFWGSKARFGTDCGNEIAIFSYHEERKLIFYF